MSNPIPLLRASQEIARALATAPTMEHAARAILRALCIALKWDVGILWLVDAALYRAKRGGRNRVEVALPRP